MIVLSIDPGASAGWALFTDGELSCCGLSKAKGKSATQRIIEHAANIPFALADLVVCERGTWRGGGKGSMTPAQLADFNATAGQLAGRNGVLYTPDEWKGMVPKEHHQPRILEALTAGERALVGAVKCGVKARMDLIDAVGIGLYHLRRMKRQPAAPRLVKPRPKAKRTKRLPKTKRVDVLSARKPTFSMKDAA